MMYEQAGFMYEWQKAYAGIQQKKALLSDSGQKGFAMKKARW